MCINDVILINVSDISEKVIPDIGYALLEDFETGEQVMVNTSDENFQRQYREIISKVNEKQKREFQRLKIDMIEATSAEPFDRTFNRFFDKRQYRR